MKELKYLSEIDFSSCFLGNAGTVVLLNSLMESNPYLVVLSIAFNEIDDYEASYCILEFLYKKKYLELLDVAGNDLEPDVEEKLLNADLEVEVKIMEDECWLRIKQEVIQDQTMKDIIVYN